MKIVGPRTRKKRHALHKETVWKFGILVLQQMSEDKDWSSDTLQLISDTANNLGLATTTSTGHFGMVHPNNFKLPQ